MKCYVCNSQLDNNSDYCLKCGADVSVYRIVVRTSNTYKRRQPEYQMHIIMQDYIKQE